MARKLLAFYRLIDKRLTNGTRFKYKFHSKRLNFSFLVKRLQQREIDVFFF